MQESHCLFCGHDNAEAAAFCNRCGSPLDWQRCPQCGGVDKRAVVQCHRCGHRYHDAGDATASLDEGATVRAEPEVAATLSPIMSQRNVAEEEARADRLIATLRERVAWSEEPLPFGIALPAGGPHDPDRTRAPPPRHDGIRGVARAPPADSANAFGGSAGGTTDEAETPTESPERESPASVAGASFPPSDVTPVPLGVTSRTTVRPQRARTGAVIAGIVGVIAAGVLVVAYLPERHEPSAGQKGDAAMRVAPIIGSAMTPIPASPAKMSPSLNGSAPAREPVSSTPEAPSPSAADPIKAPTTASSGETAPLSPPPRADETAAATPKAPPASTRRSSVPAPATAPLPAIAQPRGASPVRECSPDIEALGLCTINNTKRER